MHPLFQMVEDLTKIRGEQYNAGSISVESYEIFGLKSWGHDVHKEATRICSWIELNNIEKVEEHLIDLCVYATFLYNTVQKRKELNL